MTSLQRINSLAHEALPPWETVVVLSILGAFLAPHEAMLWRQVPIDDACGATTGWWTTLLFVRMEFDVLEAAVVATLMRMGLLRTLRRAVLLVMSISLKALVFTTVLKWAVGSTPRDSKLNASYCEWRAANACWKTPNPTLETYEKLFPVTQASLFRREFSQPFRPLETRYEISVLWNAMVRCRDFSTHGESTRQPHRSTVFEALPTDAAVDAWCGATYLSRGQQGELLVSYDAASSPAETFSGAVATTCEGIQAKIDMHAVVHWLVVLAVALGSIGGWSTVPQTMRPRSPPPTSIKVKQRHDDEKTDESEPPFAELTLPAMDPSWVDVDSQAS